MDGNSRWATARGQPSATGHRAGVTALRTLIKSCLSYNIPALTVFALSSENWAKRDHGEISLLLNLMESSLSEELDNLIHKGVRLQFIGELSLLPPSLLKAIQYAELATADNHALHLTVALSYSGRQDIANAAQQLAVEVAQGLIHPSDITPEAIAEKLATRRLPEPWRQPDLIIRTSGEQRLSNFLLWEAAYSELYFSECNWPDFGAKELEGALREYGRRERRFGGRRRK
jgi:undecaprenyl diphosphate synthase